VPFPPLGLLVGFNSKFTFSSSTLAFALHHAEDRAPVLYSSAFSSIADNMIALDCFFSLAAELQITLTFIGPLPFFARVHGYLSLKKSRRSMLL
jgi:hypothetical protein